MSKPILEGKVVLIVGAGREPGPALAQAFAQQGAILAVNDLSPVVLDPVAEAVQKQQGKVKTYVGDATRGMPLRALLDYVLEDWGRIDILVNNPRVRPAAPLIEIDEWDWQRTVEMNLNGPFLVTQLVARLMREQGQGVVLNLVESPNAGCTTDAALSAAFAASQAGLLAFSEAAAHELIAYNIRVYALCLEKPLMEMETASQAGNLEALTRLAVFLSSSEAAQVPGQSFRVGLSFT